MSTMLLRYRHLRARNVVTSRSQLKRYQEFNGFPKGRYLGPNSVVWTEDEIDQWIASRPATREEALAESAEA